MEAEKVTNGHVVFIHQDLLRHLFELLRIASLFTYLVPVRRRGSEGT